MAMVVVPAVSIDLVLAQKELQISGGPREGNWLIVDCVSYLCSCLCSLRVRLCPPKAAHTIQPAPPYASIAQTTAESICKIFKQIDSLQNASLPKEICHIIAAYTVEQPKVLGIILKNGKQFPLPFIPNETVGALKKRIFENKGPSPERQNLLVAGRLLQPDTRSIAEYALKPDDVVYISSGTRG